MAILRIGKLPDRTPIKLTITVSPGLKQALDDYAVVYRETYGVDEPIGELLPAIISAFLESDKAVSVPEASNNHEQVCEQRPVRSRAAKRGRSARTHHGSRAGRVADDRVEQNQSSMP